MDNKGILALLAAAGAVIAGSVGVMTVDHFVGKKKDLRREEQEAEEEKQSKLKEHRYRTVTVTVAGMESEEQVDEHDLLDLGLKTYRNERRQERQAEFDRAVAKAVKMAMQGKEQEA